MLCSWIFYDSPWGMLGLPAITVFWCGRKGRLHREQEGERMRQECKEMLQMLATSLQAGYSVERAFQETERELAVMYGRESRLRPALEKMNRLVSVNHPVEEAFLDMALELDVEEAVSLGYIFRQAKRMGGDYGKIIRDTAEKLEEKMRTHQEIQTMIAQKRLELQIMCAMPALILCYIRGTSYDFISPLYHNAAGVLIMSGCLILYGAMILLGDRLIRIEI